MFTGSSKQQKTLLRMFTVRNLFFALCAITALAYMAQLVGATSIDV